MSKFLILDARKYQCYNHKCRWKGLRFFPPQSEQINTIQNEVENRDELRNKETYLVPKETISNGIKHLTSYYSIADLYYAFKDNEFALFYQPKFNIVNHNITGVEILLRWRDPEKGFVSPLTFISQDEIKRIILIIGKISLQKGCQQLKSWHQMGLDPLSVSINLNLDQFHHSDLRDYIYNGIEKSNLDPEFIELEISQETLLDDLNFSKEIISELKSLKVKTYIDNISLNGLDFEKTSIKKLLSNLPVNGIKINPSFIQDLSPDSHMYKNFKSLLAMTRNLNVDVVAQGVETKDQLGLLRSLGCYTVQGHLFDPALPVEDITDVLKANWLGRSH
ncbi:MAG: EAL domain-containing protein [Thermosynechococcaceae cyanobacterium]